MDDALHYINVKFWGGGEAVWLLHVWKTDWTCCFLFFQKEYIHRVGRTARGINGRGHALLILRPEELGFLRYLKQARVNLCLHVFSGFGCGFWLVLGLVLFFFTVQQLLKANPVKINQTF